MGLQWTIADISRTTVRMYLFIQQIFIECLLCARHPLVHCWPIEIHLGATTIIKNVQVAMLNKGEINFKTILSIQQTEIFLDFFFFGMESLESCSLYLTAHLN